MRTSRTGSTIDKEFFIKKHSVAEEGGGQWLLLTDDDGQLPGLYKGKEVPEGFAKVKGVEKKDGEKTYILVSEIIRTE
jgi:hypothetical protein